MEAAVEARTRAFSVADDVTQHDLDPSRLGLGYRQRHPVRARGEADYLSVRRARSAVGRDQAHLLVTAAAVAEHLRASIQRPYQRDLFLALQPQRRLAGDRREAGRCLD